MKLSVSIADLPLGTSFEKVFSLAKDAGIDGVEIFHGFTSRTHPEYVNLLVKKYSIPILTVHQPFWSFARLQRDESSFVLAKKHHAKLVIHPPSHMFATSKKAQAYLSWFQKQSKKYNVKLLIENMPKVEPLGHLPFGYDQVYIDPVTLYNSVCLPYGFAMTFDTSHFRTNSKKDYVSVASIFPKVGNIHLSDFSPRKDHLSLDSGDFSTRDFFRFLKRVRYTKIVTLELTGNIFYPSYYEDVAKSLRLMKKLSQEV